MAVTKLKDMPPFWVLSVFGQSYNNYRHAEQLFRLFQEIEFKASAVTIAFSLILEQEKTIQELHKTGRSGRSYLPEVEQMAYLGFFLDAVYALTERIAHVTKIFNGGKLKDGFNKQRNSLLENPKNNPQLSELLSRIEWYDLFREVRVQHSHYGTSILAFGYDKEPETGSSQLIIEIGGGGLKKILKGTRYNFDIRRTTEIKDGVSKFIQEWALILISKLDANATISGKKVSKEATLKDFMMGRI